MKFDTFLIFQKFLQKINPKLPKKHNIECGNILVSEKKNIDNSPNTLTLINILFQNKTVNIKNNIYTFKND